MMKFLGLIVLAVATRTDAAIVNSYGCVSVAAGAGPSTSPGFFYADTLPDAAVWAPIGSTTPSSGNFCELSEFHQVTVGQILVAASSTNPLMVAFGKLDAGAAGNFFVTETTDMLGICDLGTYTTDSTEQFDIEPNTSPVSFSALALSKQTLSGSPGCEYATTQASIYMGSSTMGGTVAIATYGNTGTAACVTNVNSYQLPIDNGCGVMGEGSSTSDYTMGDRGSLTTRCSSSGDMCIGTASTGTPTGGTCSDRSFGVGATKYSIMLRSAGSNFDWSTAQCSTGGGTTPSYIAIRQAYVIGPMGGATALTITSTNGVSFNSGTSAASIGPTDITQMTIGDISLTFPTGYNYGTVSGTDFTTTGQGTVKVRYTPLSDETFYLDYIFPVGHLNAANTWIAYDPDVACSGDCTGSSSSATAARASVGVVGALAMIAVAWTGL